MAQAYSDYPRLRNPVICDLSCNFDLNVVTI